MNLYRGCAHNCAYCDGRSEGYYVEGEFGKDVFVKTNAVEVLSCELDPRRKRLPYKKSFIVVGGGVGDSYQPIEKKYKLTRRTLELITKFQMPVHILTKSTLIERDLNILKSINEASRVIVSFSFSSTSEKMSCFVEPGASSPSDKLKTIERFKNQGITCGIFLLPVIPFLTDSVQLIEDAVSKAKDVGVDFIIFGSMTLKDGRQKDHFINVVNSKYPELAERYKTIYTGSKWGEATREYSKAITMRFGSIARKYRMPVRIPFPIFKDLLSENDLVVVLLEHIDYLLRLRGRASSFGYAAYSISQLKESISDIRLDLRRIKGVNKTVEAVILEILNSRKSSYYENLLL
jgi:DNA repair photolyase